MATLTKETGPQSTAVFTAVFPWKDVSQQIEKAYDEAIKSIEVKGFRRGKAPKELAKKHIKKDAVVQEALQTLLTDAYKKIIQEHNLTPIAQPKIESLDAAEEKDWKFKISIALKPAVSLKNYKEAIKKLKTDKSAKGKIWVPGQKEEKEKKPADTKPTLDEILQTLLKHVSVELPPLIVEQETERMLSRLIADTQKLGLSLDRYLASINKTSEQIRKEYAQQATHTLTLEFALETLAESEKLTINDADIDAFIDKAKTEKEKTDLKKQKYQLAIMLRRQKTLEFLSNL